MRKSVLFWAMCLLILGTNAQFFDAGHNIINDVNFPQKASPITSRSAQNPTTCGGDTSTFPSYGSTAYNTVTVRRGSSLGQFYGTPQPMTISGFRFFALAVTPTPARDVKIKLICNLYKAGLDSLPSGRPIASDTIEVDTVQGANIPLSRIQRDAYFGKDIQLNFPYIIAVESDSTDVAAGVVSNSWANRDGKFRNLCVGSVSGIWYRCLNLNISGTTFNSHMQFYPFVKYTLGTDFKVKQACYPGLDTLHFPNESPNNILSSIYYNRYVYSNIERFSHRWNFDNRFYTNAIDGAYKPITKSNIRVELISTLYPYTGTFCRDTAVKIAYFQPTRPSLLQDAKACKGDDAKISIQTDNNAEVLWYHFPGDTGAFFKGKTLEIQNAQNNDTFYVKAVNLNCESIFVPVYFQVYDYPSYITVKNDSICAGATANLQVVTDQGLIHWFVNPSLGKPFHTGNNYQTEKLQNDTIFYVTAENNGCFFTKGLQAIQAFVGEDFAPSLPITPNDTFICLNQQQSIELSASTRSNNDTLRWFTDAVGGKPIAKGDTYTFTAKERGKQIVYVESWNGICGSGRTPVTLNVKNFPQIFGASGATACENDTALLSASVPWGQLQWFENKTDTQAFYIGKTPQVAGFTGTKFYYLKSSEDACYNPNFDSVSVTFNAVPKPTKMDAPSVCGRANGYMQVEVPFGKVNWYIDSISEEKLYEGSYYDLGMILSNRSRWFEVENAGCKSARQELNLIMKPRPAAGFTYTIAWQHRVSCTPISSTGLTLEWYWGDGNYKKGLPAWNQYAEAGEYTIRLIATSNSNGCKDTVDIPVSVNHVGTEEIAISDKGSILAYPNPIVAGSALHLEGVSQGKFALYNTIGKLFFACDFNEDRPILLPETLPCGWYTIQVVDSDKMHTTKILVTP